MQMQEVNKMCLHVQTTSACEYTWRIDAVKKINSLIVSFYNGIMVHFYGVESNDEICKAHRVKKRRFFLFSFFLSFQS